MSARSATVWMAAMGSPLILRGKIWRVLFSIKLIGWGGHLPSANTFSLTLIFTEIANTRNTNVHPENTQIGQVESHVRAPTANKS